MPWERMAKSLTTKSAPAKATAAPAMPPAAPAARKFTRSSSDKWIAGAAGGRARYFSIDVRLMRIITLVLCLTGAGLLAYILLWIFIPQE